MLFRSDLSFHPLEQLTYGQSITDACIDMATTTELLEKLAAAVDAGLVVNAADSVL